CSNASIALTAIWAPGSRARPTGSTGSAASPWAQPASAYGSLAPCPVCRRSAKPFAAGELSFSKVRAMSRVATADNEGTLMRVAQHGTASHLERLVRGYRRAERAKEIEQANEQHAARELQCWY